jgi:hypothetical protein
MEECTKLAVRHEVPIEVSHIACGIRRPHPVGLNLNLQFKFGFRGTGSPINDSVLGLLWSPRTTVKPVRRPRRARGRPRYTSPFPPHSGGCRGHLTRSGSDWAPFYWLPQINVQRAVRVLTSNRGMSDGIRHCRHLSLCGHCRILDKSITCLFSESPSFSIRLTPPF